MASRSSSTPDKPYSLSPALTFLRHALDQTRTSNRRCGYAIDHAMQAVIVGHIRMESDDLTRAMKSYQRYARTDEEKSGLSISCWLGEGTLERWYTLAASSKNATVLTALERVLNRKRVVVEGEILHLGARVRLPEAVSEGNLGGHCEVSSYSKDGLHVNFLYRKDGHFDSDSIECRTCRQTRHVGSESKHRIKVPVATLVAREKARIAVMGRTYEVENPTSDPPLREYAGKALVDAYRGRIVEIAALGVGEEVRVGADGEREGLVVRRIAYRTHDALARAARGEAFGTHRGYRGSEPDTIEDLGLMAKDGLVVPQPHDEHSSFARFAITEKGRERLDALSTQREREAAQAKRARERETEQEARQRLTELAEQARTLTAAEASRQTGMHLLEADLDREVSFQDSRTVGNCREGTMAWISQHLPGVDPFKDKITIRQLVALDAGKNRINVNSIIRFVLRRHVSQTG